MSRILFATILVVLPITVDDPPKTGNGPFEGSWKLVVGMVGDRSFIQKPEDAFTWVVDKYVVRAKRDGKLDDMALNMKLDPKTDPKTIDLFLEGKDEPLFLGIYAVKGDRLHIRYNRKTRPQSFEADQPASQPFDVIMEFRKE